MAFTLVVVVGPGTRAGQAAWALGGSGHVEGVSLGRGRKARCGGPRDAGWARQKPWSQQTLVSPRLWLKGNQMLPAPCLFPWSPACPPPGPPSVPLLPGLSVSALRLSSRSPSVLPALRPSSRPSVRPPSPCPSVLPVPCLSSWSSVHPPDLPSVLPVLQTEAVESANADLTQALAEGKPDAPSQRSVPSCRPSPGCSSFGVPPLALWILW